jgi:hypothetical protein
MYNPFIPQRITYQSDPATTTPQVASTNPVGNVAQRHNNPSNLMYAGQPNATQGEPKSGGGYWARFQNENDGYQAGINDTKIKLKNNPNMTVAQWLDKLSPPSENNVSNVHYNVMDELKDLKDSGKIPTLMANKLLVSQVPLDRLVRAKAKAEGFYASTTTPSTPQVTSKFGNSLDLPKGSNPI